MQCPMHRLCPNHGLDDMAGLHLAAGGVRDHDCTILLRVTALMALPTL